MQDRLPSSRAVRARARRRAPVLLMTVAAAAAACAEAGSNGAAVGDASGAAGPEARALALADRYAEAYYEQFPEEAYEFGYTGAPTDRWSDRSRAALDAWAAREDSLLAALREIDPAALAGNPAEIPYAYALDRLESSVGRRVCRMELWNVSPTWTGWPEAFPSVLSQQTVRAPSERAALLARVRDVPRYLDTEIANLRAGVASGYVAARVDVEAVVAQIDALLNLPEDESPFREPASRSDDDAFAEALAEAVRTEVTPAVRRYRDYLAGEYSSSAREAVGVSANPDGSDCYRASIRFHTTLDTPPREIHETGLREMDRIQRDMRAIARRIFGTADVKEALRRAQEPPFTFGTAQEIVAYAGAAVARAEVAMPRAFGFVPDAEVVIRPYPAFQKRTGGGFYSAGSAGEPGVYQLGTHAPGELSKAGLEATSFHETWPGHHLQAQVVLARGGANPVLKYFYNSGMGEGWALYSEKLSDELGLYSGDIDRLGQLSNEALRAARLVVDPGMHALGWTRERAVAYMRENTAESPGAIDYEVDRYIAVPGQATAYLLGSLEIQRLRAEASDRLGDAFDLRAFHDRVLENGTISLPMLRAQVERWIAAQPGAPEGHQGEAADAVSAVLDELHAAASAADFDRYFGLYTDDAVFLGTDATERWTIAEFMEYARGPFSEGRGWTYDATERHVSVSDDGATAWFDERLENEFLGETRGSGVLELEDGAWKIAQYNLTIPVPNDLAGEFVERIRGLEPDP
jgi:uncharacterized protein (DUF885 family)/ketosteroid isomerase-like protein